ncbi:MAG TPA: hypothetical protein VKB75_05755 [Jatrophihabitans sp.]|nr:hypothetical protein [Jatrophihabitans sp.]
MGGMGRVFANWAATWRVRRLVFVLGLLADAACIAMTVAVFTNGLGSRPFAGFLLLALVLQGLHDAIVRIYDRREHRSSAMISTSASKTPHLPVSQQVRGL